VTSGIVSALHRQMQAPNRFTINDSIQTDAPINHGNSGGPLIDMAARVIGVNTQIQSDSGGSDGVGFAIPSNTVKEVVTQLVAGKAPEYAYLGVQVSRSTSPPGAELAEVIAGTPADEAGLEAGDVITKLDSTTIASPDDLSDVIDEKKPRDELEVTYVRDGKTHTVTVTLGTRPSFG
jgi:putative serine protease PepD